MFLFRKPSNEFISAQRELDFSDPNAHLGSMEAPRGYKVDHNRIELGEGEEVFVRAVSAVRSRLDASDASGGASLTRGLPLPAAHSIICCLHRQWI